MRVLGIIFILLAIPAAIMWLKAFPRQRKWAYFAVGLLPFTIAALNLDAALVSWPAWTGYAKGLIVTALDALAIALIVVSRRPLRRLPFLSLFICYFLAATLSMAVSALPMSSSFYAFQLARITLVFIAVSSFAGHPGALRWLAFGLAAGAIFQAAVTIDQRFSGVVQASGTMGHQNLLGLMLHFVTLPLVALLLAGERSKLVMAGVLASLIAVALGASRGAVAFVAIGAAALVILSLVRRATAHKWRVVGLAALTLAIVAPIIVTSFDERFEKKPIYEGTDSERLAFERAAKAMWADHPMGVGANQYVVVANSAGYSERAGVIWNYASRSAKVHNMYLLAAAETGWPGLVMLVLLFAWPLLRGLGFAFRNRSDPRGEIVLGAAAAIFATALHGFYEWVFFTSYAQYVFVISAGIIAGSIRQSQMEKALQRRKPRPIDPTPRSRETTAGRRPVSSPPLISERH